MKNLWSTPQRCRFSPGTAVHSHKGPRILRRAAFTPGSTNADIGGGPYPEMTLVLAERRVRNVVYDPGHQDAETNRRAATRLRGGRAQTATVSNVLNVIPDVGCREQVIRQAADAVGRRGVAYFTVYVGDKSGRGKMTLHGWQENRSLRTYLPEVRRVFREVRIKNGVIVARNG